MKLLKHYYICVSVLLMNSFVLSEQLSIYKFLPGSEGLQVLYQPNLLWLDLIEVGDVDSLVFWVKQDSILTEGDFIIIYHGINSYANDVYMVDFKMGRRHNQEDLRAWFTEINDEFKNLNNLSNYKDREFELIDPKIIHPESLSLNFNEDKNQIIKENVSLTDPNSLYDNSMYIKLKLESTDDVYVKITDPSQKPDTFKVVDLDNPSKKIFENVARSNLEHTRILYTTKDSLIRNNIEIYDYKKKVLIDYKIFTSNKSDIPQQAKINVDDAIIDSTEIKDVMKIDNRGDQEIISVEVAVTDSTRLDDNVYSITQPHILKKVNAFNVSNPRNVRALVQDVYSDNYLTMTPNRLKKVDVTFEDGSTGEAFVESAIMDLSSKEVSSSIIRYTLMVLSFSVTLLSSL